MEVNKSKIQVLLQNQNCLEILILEGGFSQNNEDLDSSKNRFLQLFF